MKINGRCRVCNRDFPVDVLLTKDSAGHCPFCGTPLDPHYGAMLVNSLAAAQRSGTAFVHDLEQLAHFGPNLEIDIGSVLDPIKAALVEHAARSAV